MTKSHLRLQPSESVVAQAAARIYAAYISADRVPEGSQDEWIERSIREAIRIAEAVDAAIISDGEVESQAGQSLGEPLRRTPPSTRLQQ